MRTYYFTMCLGLLWLAGSEAALRTECYRGSEIAPHTKELVEMVNRTYREAPYNYSGESPEYNAYLETFAKTSDAIVCLAFDDAKVIGVAAAMPLSKSKENYRKPLADRGYDLDKIFYLGEFGLQPDYVGSGTRNEMLNKIEKIVRESGKYQMLSFWEVNRETPSTVLGYVPQDDFWTQHGFKKQPEISFTVNWKNVNATEKSPHNATYWIKKLQ